MSPHRLQGGKHTFTKEGSVLYLGISSGTTRQHAPSLTKSISCDILFPKLFRLNPIKPSVLTLILQEIQGRLEQVKQYHKGSKVHKVAHSKERLARSQQITVKESKREGGGSTLKETWMASRWNAMCGLWLESDLKQPFWGQLGNFSHGLGITWC